MDFDAQKVTFKTMQSTEASLQADMEHYYQLLPYEVRKCFPSPKQLVESTFKGFDAHCMDIISEHGQMVGKVFFNLDTMLQKKTQKHWIVDVWHISCLNSEKYF